MHEQGFSVRTRGLCPGAGAGCICLAVRDRVHLVHWPTPPTCPGTPKIHTPPLTPLLPAFLEFHGTRPAMTNGTRALALVLMLPSSCFSSGNSRLPSTSQGVGKLKAQLRCFFLLFPFAFPLPLLLLGEGQGRHVHGCRRISFCCQIVINSFN